MPAVSCWRGASPSGAADEQAGRPPGTRVDVVPPNLDQMRRRIAEGSIYLWETPQGEVVHLSAVNGPSFGVSRIGPVFTPDAHRGHGYASAAVALLTRQILDSGTRACLFTDQANPTSNAIYQALGYEAVCDTGEVAIEVKGETRPCELMDDDGRTGLQAALRPQRRGGVYGQILHGGEIRVGDGIALLPLPNGE